MTTQPAFDFTVPAARTTDPDTSHEAAARHSASGARGTNAERVLQSMVRGYPETFREIALRAGMDCVEVMRRLNDLRCAGLVEVGPKRECRIARTRMQTWVRR